MAAPSIFHASHVEIPILLGISGCFNPIGMGIKLCYLHTRDLGYIFFVSPTYDTSDTPVGLIDAAYKRAM